MPKLSPMVTPPNQEAVMTKKQFDDLQKKLIDKGYLKADVEAAMGTVVDGRSHKEIVAILKEKTNDIEAKKIAKDRQKKVKELKPAKKIKTAKVTK